MPLAIRFSSLGGCTVVEATAGEFFILMDQLLDHARTGPLHLQRPDFAAMVADAIQHLSLAVRRYDLHAFVVMPNHVHLLITPLQDVTKITQSLKRFTGREGNRMLGAVDRPFWQEESYDRLVRDEQEFHRIVHYIHWNPVKAGLAAKPEEFRWCSAFASHAEADFKSAAG
jgi:REP element-mobilizing transposase RayT